MGGENEKKTVAAITGTRADFGLLRPALDALKHTGCRVRLLVTGSHLVDALGYTLTEIEEAGFCADAKIDILQNNPAEPESAAFARAFSGFSDWFSEYRPDILLLLGDRYETLAAAVAAAVNGVPVAHISGGDVTAGAKDDMYRHCITKLSCLHFPSTEAYRKRVVQLGEDPARVHNAGALGAENIRSLPVFPKERLSGDVGFDFSHPFLLVTYHPETLSGRGPAESVAELLAALDELGMPALFTMANADGGGGAINRALLEYCNERPRHKLVKSLGAARYLSAMRLAAAVVGNSSSAIVETPSLKIPAVNIGNRQEGRTMGENVISCGESREEIAAAVRKAVSPDFRTSIADMSNPYGGENVGKKIAGKVAAFLRSGAGAKKLFYDIDFFLPSEPADDAADIGSGKMTDCQSDTARETERSDIKEGSDC